MTQRNTEHIDDPAELFLKYNYQKVAQLSTLKKAVELKLAKLPKLALLLYGKFFKGYSIYEFSYHKAS